MTDSSQSLSSPVNVTPLSTDIASAATTGATIIEVHATQPPVAAATALSPDFALVHAATNNLSRNEGTNIESPVTIPVVLPNSNTPTQQVNLVLPTAPPNTTRRRSFVCFCCSSTTFSTISSSLSLSNLCTLACLSVVYSIALVGVLLFLLFFCFPLFFFCVILICFYYSCNADPIPPRILFRAMMWNTEIVANNNPTEATAWNDATLSPSLATRQKERDRFIRASLLQRRLERIVLLEKEVNLDGSNNTQKNLESGEEDQFTKNQLEVLSVVSVRHNHNHSGRVALTTTETYPKRALVFSKPIKMSPAVLISKSKSRANHPGQTPLNNINGDGESSDGNDDGSSSSDWDWSLSSTPLEENYDETIHFNHNIDEVTGTAFAESLPSLPATARTTDDVEENVLDDSSSPYFEAEEDEPIDSDENDDNYTQRYLHISTLANVLTRSNTSLHEIPQNSSFMTSNTHHSVHTVSSESPLATTTTVIPANSLLRSNESSIDSLTTDEFSTNRNMERQSTVPQLIENATIISSVETANAETVEANHVPALYNCDEDGSSAYPNERGTMCDICLLEYQIGDLVAWSQNKKCDHAYHVDCIIDWLMRPRTTTCPSCRQEYFQIGVTNSAMLGSDENV